MVQLRSDMVGKSGLKHTIKEKGILWHLQTISTTKQEVNKDAKALKDSGWEPLIQQAIFVGNGKYNGILIYALYGRIQII